MQCYENYSLNRANSRSPICQQPCLQFALQWSHNERDGASHHRCLNCLLNRLFRRHKGASNAKNVFNWWHHHGIHILSDLFSAVYCCTKASFICIQEQLLQQARIYRDNGSGWGGGGGGGVCGAVTEAPSIIFSLREIWFSKSIG